MEECLETGDMECNDDRLHTLTLYINIGGDSSPSPPLSSDHTAQAQVPPCTHSSLSHPASPVNDVAIASTTACPTSSPSISGVVVRLQEIAPVNSTIFNSDADIDRGISLDMFQRQRHGTQREDKALPRRIRKYYRHQDELIDEFGSDILKYGKVEMSLANSSPSEQRLATQATRMSKISLLANLVLLIAKVVAAIYSGSLSIISSLVDSCVDLLSGIVIYAANRAMSTTSQYTYPQGRQKLEPVAILVLSVVMSLASIQVMVQSVEVMVSGAIPLDLTTTSIIIVTSTVVVKAALYLLCRGYKNPSIQALSQDHRNDVLSNLVALAGALLGNYVWIYSDPIGAIVISIYIFISWSIVCLSQIRLITGYTADPKFLKRITWLCLNHDSRIQAIDTVRAFHFGTNFIVEVDIVLPEHMTLREAHDIGEPLQQKLERFPQVERAFVHLDYEFTHDPADEHVFRGPHDTS